MDDILVQSKNSFWVVFLDILFMMLEVMYIVFIICLIEQRQLFVTLLIYNTVILFLVIILNFQDIVISKQGVYVKTLFSKIYFPLDSLTSAGTTILQGVYAGTSSATFRFVFIENYREIDEVLHNLLKSRQEKTLL